ncbi:Transmembrane protein 8B [Camelus dromedarius]|uniref:Transmembrane protein 8B n=1 Tax=Camelus dromedarius TaxID=9838 RepID=A0A5N4E8I3_CAMDR|nr:Transmembrane protein 8B [Camelus dromedarius]
MMRSLTKASGTRARSGGIRHQGNLNAQQSPWQQQSGHRPGGLFLTDYSTCSPRKLSPFRSFASTELFHFHVPEDTFLAVWNLIIFKEQGGTFGDHCPDQSVTVYFRSGAPPVINPLHTHFPGDTAVPGVFSLTLSWTLPNRTSGIFNISSPLPGDWFLAAHLPQAHGHISVKGLQDECQYLLQPQLIVRRLLDVAVLVPGRPSEQTLSPHNRSALYNVSLILCPSHLSVPCLFLPPTSPLPRVFVPSFTYRVSAQLVCVGGRGASACPLTLRLRPKAPPLHNSSSVACGGTSVCQLELALPPWGHWVYVRVETPSRGPGRTIRFQLCVRLQECPQPSLSRALVPGAAMNMPQSLGSQSLPPEPPSLGAPAEGPGATTPPEHCWPVRPTLRNELDTFSVHFYIFFGPSVALPPERPAVFALRLLPVLDSGGVLSLELQLNAVLFVENGEVALWWNLKEMVSGVKGPYLLQEAYPESLAGFLLTVSATSRVARLRIPFPQTGTWFLTLRSLCGVGPRFVRCRNATAEVRLRTFLSPCVDDCGPYGQCKLLRTHNYLYAACECKAGWRGWGCTDSADALTYGFQLLSTLLLCLSNLMFLPPVVLAIRSRYVLEAAVYTFTMFFSTFYHACDQPGIVVFCIMDYDVLQFCDFLGSLMSVWVTVIAMARLQPVVKQVLYLLGAMLLSMALQLDRHGLWNLLGPSLFALGILATAWTVRSVRRRHCYPPTWRRWLFYLCPGSLIAGSAVLLYAFVETRDNYFYIHSIWHMLIAGSVGFLLPPRAKTDHRVPSGARARGCGYQLCINEQEELGLVGPGGATVSSICAS